MSTKGPKASDGPEMIEQQNHTNGNGDSSSAEITKEKEAKSVKETVVIENGNGKTENGTSKTSERVTRRSRTPQLALKKTTPPKEDTKTETKTDELAKITEETTVETTENEDKGAAAAEVKENGTSEQNGSTNGSDEVVSQNKTEDGEIDALTIAGDEPCPELEFDENSDFDTESNTNSPVITRCKTRRSQTRNVPTPKTPKIFDDPAEISVPPTPEVPTAPETKEVDLNETDTSIASDMTDMSTKAEVGSDKTRLDFMNDDREDSDIIAKIKSNSFHGISARKTIRPISEDFRKRTLRNNLGKADLSLPYSSRDSMERAPSVKRKGRSETPENIKRTRFDSPGIIGFLSSPFSSIKNRFSSSNEELIASSTPKLTAYKDRNIQLDSENENNQLVVQKESTNWCSIM